jgi:hypothetical protein
MTECIFILDKNYKDIQSYEVMKTGCFANVELIIWLLILDKLNKSPSIQIWCKKNGIWMRTSPFPRSTICPNVPGAFTLKVLRISRTPRYPSDTLHIHRCVLVDTIGITTRVIALTVTFLLHFKDGGKKTFCIFVFSSTRSIVLHYPTFNSHFHKLQKCFLSNGTKNMHILATGS